MNEQKHKTMNMQNTNNESMPPKGNNSANMAGAFIVVFGLALLLRNTGLNIIPRWIFSWEMILIVIGLVIGINSKFEKKASYVLITIGAVFLLKDMTGLSFGRFILPMAVVVLGLYLIKRNRNTPTIPPDRPSKPDDDYDWDKRVDPTFTGRPYHEDSSTANQPADNYTAESSDSAKYKKYTTQYENYLKVDSFFSDTKKIMLTSNFLGGTITSVFGSTNINFLQADIKQPVVLDTFQLFGSTKIIIPPHWQVSSNVASIFGELDDRRPMFEITTDSNKKIYITGTSIFGGLTIKNS